MCYLITYLKIQYILLNMNFNEYPSYDEFDLDNNNELMNKNRFIPLKLFKYTNVYRSKDLLYYNSMYLPEISELNDPYEGELLYDNELVENAGFGMKGGLYALVLCMLGYVLLVTASNNPIMLTIERNAEEIRALSDLQEMVLCNLSSR